MRRLWLSRPTPIVGFGLLLCALLMIAPSWASAQQSTPQCLTPFQLDSHRLKDHTLFESGGWWYLVSINRVLPPDNDPYGEYNFVYLRTQDFCGWEFLGYIIGRGPAGSADERYVWAPHVIQVGDTFYMYYTGVNQYMVQAIMLATTTTPEQAESWVKRGVVFRPNHAGMVYPGGEEWSDNRDPMVRFYNGRYYLYYTGRDEGGGIVGVASALTPNGPFQDLGPLLTEANAMPESPFVLEHDGDYYLYYNFANPTSPDRGARWRWAPSPFGPWQTATLEGVGWAHDFVTMNGDWYSSFVMGPGTAIGFLPVQWQAGRSYEIPQIGERLYLPLAIGVTDSPAGN